MSYQLTLWDTPNVTSSPVSVFGATPYAAPDGPTIGQCGPEVAPVPLSALPEKRSPAHNAVAQSLYRMLSEQGYSDAQLAATTGMRTAATSGLNFTGSSKSAALSSHLGNKLQEVTASLGATLYKQRWNLKITPSGVSLLAHVVSARQTFDSDSIGWLATTLSGWPTPVYSSPNSLRGKGQDPLKRKAGGHSVNLQDAVTLCGWPTPRAAEAGPDYAIADLQNSGGISLQTAPQFAGWSTPAASDGTGGKRPHPDTTMAGQHPSGRKVNMGLASQVHIGFLNTEPARLTASGVLLTGSSAGMESGGQLNPSLSRWLMGLPIAWDIAALQVFSRLTRSRKAKKKI